MGRTSVRLLRRNALCIQLAHTAGKRLRSQGLSVRLGLPMPNEDKDTLAGDTGALLVRHYCVEGRVQGVGFRWFVHREAAGLKLRGWVRNTQSGAVEVMAAGTREQLDQLRAVLEQGSRGSRVDHVAEEELPGHEADALGTFTIEGAW